jgi:retinoblastoma-like protein 1
MKELFEKRILKGEDSDNMSDILEMPHFTGNNKSLSQEYDRFILSQGEFDEHIFLGEDAYLQIGTPSKTMTAPNTPFEARSKVSRNLARHFEKASVLTPPTPLTGRTYLSDKGPQTTPVSSATQAVMRLRSLLQGYGNKPSKNLSEILSWCGEGFGDQLNTLLERLGKKFMENYNQPFDECSSSQLAEDRLLLANRLFFRLMDLVLSSEQKRLQDSFKPCVQALLSKDDFSSSVFACCVEIVLFSYNSNQCFPWIIQVLNIQSYNFYKVIEVIVKEEPGLSRGVVKHLNQIEESILDSMAWKSGSLLFDVLETVDYNVPKYEDVQGTALQSQACASVTSQVSVTPVPALARSAAASQFSSSMVARRQLGLPMSVPTSPAVALPVPPEKGKGMAKQKQSRSLNLFFRKVYHLAYVRMAHLCDRLEISADQIQK